MVLIFYELQQYLPFTVLKPALASRSRQLSQVATVLTVYGIETYRHQLNQLRLAK